MMVSEHLTPEILGRFLVDCAHTDQEIWGRGCRASVSSACSGLERTELCLVDCVYPDPLTHFLTRSMVLF